MEFEKVRDIIVEVMDVDPEEVCNLAEEVLPAAPAAAVCAAATVRDQAPFSFPLSKHYDLLYTIFSGITSPTPYKNRKSVLQIGVCMLY